MSYSLDNKPRAHSPSEGNVVDHHAANGVFQFELVPYLALIIGAFQVTDELPAGPRSLDPKSTMIQVQPLKRSEMQVRLDHL